MVHAVKLAGATQIVANGRPSKDHHKPSTTSSGKSLVTDSGGVNHTYGHSR